MEIYEALKKDHDELKMLLAPLVETAPGSPERRRVAQAVKEELIPHSPAEEAEALGEAF
jgi:hypothetical protein